MMKRIEKYLDDDSDCFFLTYADAVADINIKDLYAFHKKSNTLATISVVKRDERFGVVEINDNKVNYFREKFLKDDEWINAGVMVINKEILKKLDLDSSSFEKEILDNLVKKKNYLLINILVFGNVWTFKVKGNT